MDNVLMTILESIAAEMQPHIQVGARHYLEVSIAKQAEKLGYDDLKERFKDTYAVVPLKGPQRGMKVRIDGRTFVNYAEYPSGIAVPGYLARKAGGKFKTYVPNDSMICNFV